jgi:hypothetical protein
MDNPGVDDDSIYAEVDTKKGKFRCTWELLSGTIKSENNRKCHHQTTEDYLWQVSRGNHIDSTIDMHCWCVHSFHTKDHWITVWNCKIEQGQEIQVFAIEILHQNLENLRQESAQSISCLR